MPKVVDTERAEEIQRKLQKQRRSNPNFYTQKGNRYLFDGEIDDTEIAFKKSIELENDNHYAWFGLAKVNSMRGERVTISTNLKKAQRYGRRDGFSSRYASIIAELEVRVKIY